jgi:mono/diheme cytochrome c family protein/plastocyanin
MVARGAARLLPLLVIGLSLGFVCAPFFALWLRLEQTVEVHGHLSELGGWSPGTLTVAVNQPLHLRFTSDDVPHGFAVGQTDWPSLEVLPGEKTTTTLIFDRPGTYTFYCTRWCGLNHWRMRGVIEVTGPATVPETPQPPLYLTLGIDLDAPHPATVVPEQLPSALRGSALVANLPPLYRQPDYYRAHSPAEMWQAVRAETTAVTDAEVWDLVAWAWQSHTTREALKTGQQLYTDNCAACHGATGAGDGVLAQALAQPPSGPTEMGHTTTQPIDLTEATSMLGASPALLYGKIIRGGMGTGMPYWGPIFTEAQTWALVDYLWTFQFETELAP